jgi:plasminogen activator inhibitor 1 RNA-binding protein
VTGKQAAQGWGSKAGDQTLLDEKVGEEIARTEEQEEGGATPAEGNEAAEQAEQERAKSYAEYLAELEQQKNDELGVKEARKPNEGVKVNSQWATAKELKRAEDEDAYIRGKEEKARREKQRKEKTYVDVDMRFVEPSRGGRGEYRGRGRGRGGPDRDGPERRERPDRPERGRGGPRGGGAPRGGRGVTVDEKNFPSLGAK